MIMTAQVLLIGAVASVGVLHTMVPDHWVPITLIARQKGWTQREVARAALIAGIGHTVSTLIIGLGVWLAGVAFATRFGNAISIVSSLALIAFGLYIAISSLREIRAGGHGHSHSHDGHHHGEHGHSHSHDFGDDGQGKHAHSTRTPLLLILGSSPMVEGIPAFFAAGKYGAGFIALMALVFAVATIATYVLLCVSSTTGLRNVKLGKFEEYGEVLSGAFIALLGAAFALWPAL